MATKHPKLIPPEAEIPKKTYRFEMVVDFDVSKCSLLEILSDVQELIEVTQQQDFDGQTVRAVLITDGELDFLSTRK